MPTIVVVDSDKDPDDQLRTMIILYKPSDPHESDKKHTKSKSKSDKNSRNKTFNPKKVDMVMKYDAGSSERNCKQIGKLSKRNSEEGSRNKKTFADSGKFNTPRTMNRPRQKDKNGLFYREHKLQRQKSTSQDCLFVNKRASRQSKWKSEGEINKPPPQLEDSESESDAGNYLINDQLNK